MILGADDYLTKPVNPDVLANAIQSRMRRYQALQVSKLAAFTQQLVLSHEHYRQQMAYVLDSDINQSLRSLQFVLGMLDTPDDAQLYEQAKTQVRHLINQIEGLAQELHPTILGQLGLLPAIRWLVSQYDLLVDLEFENMSYKFDAEVALCLFRLLQESLNNIAQHAQTNRVKITLKYAAPYVTLQVTDDGVGFDLEQTLQRSSSSMGLTYMYRLVNWLNGELSITSRPNEGTIIEASLPQGDEPETAVSQSMSRRFLRLAGQRPNLSAPTTEASGIKILLAMEQPLQRQGLKKLLSGNKQFQVVGEVQELTRTAAIIEQKPPDLLIINPVTHDKNQMELLQMMTAASPETAVLAITNNPHNEYITALLESGALGCIPNTATITDLHTAIMRVAQKQYYVSPTLNFNLDQWQKTNQQ
jgi:DNA-binding NarL/FixJ family response regulator